MSRGTSVSRDDEDEDEDDAVAALAARPSLNTRRVAGVGRTSEYSAPKTCLGAVAMYL